MGPIEPLEARALMTATFTTGTSGGPTVFLNDANDVSVTVEDFFTWTVVSEGQTVFHGILFSPQLTVVGNNGGNTISVVSERWLFVNIAGGTGNDTIHVEGTGGFLVGGQVSGGNGSDVFSLVNVRFMSVYGDNGDDVCTFVNAGDTFVDPTGSIFFGGNGDDLFASDDPLMASFEGGHGDDAIVA